MIFKDRVHAGFLLSEKLFHYRVSKSVVLGLPRGGMVVAAEVAKNLELPLDVLVVKKIPSPGNPELALGAVAPDGVTVGDRNQYFKSQIANLNDQIKQKILFYRKGEKPLSVKAKTVIIVDDGAATGATIEVSVKWLRKKQAGKIVVALPVAPIEVADRLKQIVDEFVILNTPVDFSAVGQFYEEFGQVGDEEVVELLRHNKTTW